MPLWIQVAFCIVCMNEPFYYLILESDQILELATTLKNLGAKWATEEKEEFNTLYMTVCFFLLRITSGRKNWRDNDMMP